MSSPSLEMVCVCLGGRQISIVLCVCTLSPHYMMYYSMLPVDFNISFVLDDSKFIKDFNATRHDCQLETHALTTFPLPTLHGDHPHGLVGQGEVLSCTVQELYTWLGVVAHNGLGSFYENSTANSYVSRFIPPEPHSECQNGTRKRWTGMVSCMTISHMLEKLK